MIFPFSTTTTPFAIAGCEMGWTSAPWNTIAGDCARAVGAAASASRQAAAAMDRANRPERKGIMRTSSLYGAARIVPAWCRRVLLVFQGFQERAAPALHSRLEPRRAVAVAAGPGLAAVEVAALRTRVGVLHAKHVEVLLPVGALLFDRRGTEADLDPLHATVVVLPGELHVAQVLALGDRAPTESLGVDRLAQVVHLLGFHTSGDQVAHGSRVSTRRGSHPSA